MTKKMITLVPEMMAERAPYHLVTSIVAPRPIAWISTVSADGTPNLAPFSFYSIVAGFPPTLMFSVSYRARKQPRQKDTLSNVMEVGEFVSHVVDEATAEAMAKTAVDYPPGVNEFEMAGLEVLPSIDVKPPRIAISPVAMECKVTQIIPVEQSTSIMVLGKIVRFHICEDLICENGLVDTMRLKPITRLGGAVDYAKIGKLFTLEVPDN